MAVQRALLLIADIGGYTRYMKVHRINLAHAQDIVARLLEAVIDGAKPRFKLSKLEGDAGLFYAPLPPGDPPDLTQLSQQVAAIRRAFLRRQEQIRIDRICTCDGCTQAGDLKLKFVAHAGEIAFQKVKSFTELAGMDVIVVHRMLKNSVPVSEYVLMTEAVTIGLGDAVREQAISIEEDFEGVGPTKLQYVDLNTIAEHLPPELERSRLRAWWELIKLNARSLPYILGFKKACDGFRNMNEARGLASPKPTQALPAQSSAASVSTSSPD